MTSLRARLTAAVMMPLLALALIFGGITCWMIHRTLASTADRQLVSTATLLAQAIASKKRGRDDVLPLVVGLLESRSARSPVYAVYEGDRLLAGPASLSPPPGYDPRHAETRVQAEAPPSAPAFASRGDFTGAAALPGLKGAGQPASLRQVDLGGQAFRVASVVRKTSWGGPPILVQVADDLSAREAFEQTYYLRVAGAGVLVVMIALLLFYGAITWGLRPFSSLTEQIDSGRRHGHANVRVTLAESDPLEARLLANVFNDLMARTDRATQSLRQFTANASHQLRTPLAIMRVHADVLSRYGPGTPQGAMALADIVGAVASLDRLLDQLIALARIEERSERAAPLGVFELSTLAAGTVASRVTHPDAAGMDIGFEGSAAPIIAVGDDALAAEMIGNLLDNAIRYNRANGTVTVRAWLDKGQPLVEIEDDGPGIAPADREKVWERFYRGSAAAEGREGSGLGLAIVRALGERIGASAALLPGPGGRGVLATIRFQPVPALVAEAVSARAQAIAQDDSLLTG